MALTLWQIFLLLLNCYAVARLTARVAQSTTLNENNVQSSHLSTVSAVAFLIVSGWVELHFENWPNRVQAPVPFVMPATAYAVLFAQVLYSRRMSFRLLKWGS